MHNLEPFWDRVRNAALGRAGLLAYNVPANGVNR